MSDGRREGRGARPGGGTGGGGDDARNGRRGGEGTIVCELCGGPVLDRHCKIVCLNCGYQRDCSDP